MATFRFVIRGVYPGLLTHSAEAMGNGDVKRGDNVPSPEEEAELGCYRLPDGTCGIPSAAIRSAMIRAAGAYRHRGRSLKAIFGHILTDVDLWPLLDPDTREPLRDYKIDIRRAVVQRQGVRRARPLFPRWMVDDGSFKYDAELLPDPKTMAMVLADAGLRIGVGDYRPENGGPFGRFELVEFEVVDLGKEA